jgi:hypothetical protein
VSNAAPPPYAPSHSKYRNPPQYPSFYDKLPPKQSPGTPSVAGAKNSLFPHRKFSPLDLKISLDRFCIHYEIPKSNQAKLATLEYSPGNEDVMELEESDWKEAGFSKLGWKAFIRAHEQFMKDAKAGIWV